MTPKTTTASALVKEAAALEQQGDTAKAEKIYRAMLRQAPGQPHALLALGKLKHKQGALEEAIALFDELLAAHPDTITALVERGTAHSAANRISAAVADLERAIQLNPDEPAAHHNLGSALRKDGRLTEACACFAVAEALLPDNRSILLNLATTLHEAGRMDESFAAFDRLLARFPDDAYAHSNFGSALLSMGRFAEGWREYAWRDGRHDAHIHFKHFPYARWAGEAIDGRDILVWTETGLGEEILTASMIPGAISRARSVSVLCSHRIVSLLRRSFPAALVDVRAVPPPDSLRGRPIDFQMSMSELGLCLRRSNGDFPNRRHFLTAEPGAVKQFRDKYKSIARGRRLVGISWRSANPEVGQLKSTRLHEWEPILRLPHVQFVNLQYGDSRSEAESTGAALGVPIIHDSGFDPLKDFDMAAAQASAMDMIITVSNSTAHLGGGLGVPTWVMLPEGRARFWYWQRGNAYSPWYASARLFRQTQAGDWASVIARCAEELHGMDSRAA